MMTAPAAVLLIAAFLLGSIPFGIFIARLYRVNDLREKGSGNIGATNVSRVVGFWPAGFLTLALDVAKGAGPVLLSRPEGAALWTGFFGSGVQEFGLPLIWLAGLFAVLGHCYSPWVRFKGGKGVATGLGVILVLSPWAALAGALAFILTFLRTRTGSLSSIAGLVVASLAHLVLEPVGAHLWAGAALVFLILARHESNLHALLENRERTF